MQLVTVGYVTSCIRPHHFKHKTALYPDFKQNFKINNYRFGKTWNRECFKIVSGVIRSGCKCSGIIMVYNVLSYFTNCKDVRDIDICSLIPQIYVFRNNCRYRSDNIEWRVWLSAHIILYSLFDCTTLCRRNQAQNLFHQFLLPNR